MSARSGSLRRDRLAGGGVLFFLVAMILFAPCASRPERDRDGSVTSTDPRGRAALFALLHELGFTSEAWIQRPGALPAGRSLLWLAELPPEHGVEFVDRSSKSSDASSDESHDESPPPPEPPPSPDPPEIEAPVELNDDPLREQLDAGLRAPRHYRRFVERGGSIAVAATSLDLERLVREFEFSDLAGLALEDLPAGHLVEGNVHAQYLFSEPLDVRWGTGRCFRTRDFAHEWNPLLTTADDDVLALEVPVARGRVILVANGDFLDNEQLAHLDDAVLAVRLAERGALDRRVLFDEYAVGGWEPHSALELAFSDRARVLTLHLVALFVLFVWHLAWVREFPRDPGELATASPLARARAQAALYVRAKRFDLLAGVLRNDALERIATRHALPRAAAGEPELERIARVANGVGRSSDVERWRELFAARRVASEEDLERLDREIAALERALDDASSARQRPNAALDSA